MFAVKEKLMTEATFVQAGMMVPRFEADDKLLTFLATL